MPLPERVIVPVAVCRGTLSLPVPDELEGVTNGSLANIIRFVIFMLGIACLPNYIQATVHAFKTRRRNVWQFIPRSRRLELIEISE